MKMSSYSVNVCSILKQNFQDVGFATHGCDMQKMAEILYGCVGIEPFFESLECVLFEAEHYCYQEQGRIICENPTSSGAVVMQLNPSFKCVDPNLFKSDYLLRLSRSKLFCLFTT